MFPAARQCVPLYFSIWRNIGLLKIRTRETKHRLCHGKPETRLFRETTMASDIHPHRFLETLRFASVKDSRNNNESPSCKSTITRVKRTGWLTKASWVSRLADQMTFVLPKVNDIVRMQSCCVKTRLHAWLMPRIELRPTSRRFLLMRKAYANASSPPLPLP